MSHDDQPKPPQDRDPQTGGTEFEGILQDLAQLTEERTSVCFGVVFDTLGARGLGPLMMVLAAFLILPIGLIPGVPAVIGAVVFAIGLQFLRGASGLWLPQRIRCISLPADRLHESLEKAAPRAKSLGKYLRHRVVWAAEGRLSLMLIGLILVAVGTIIVFGGFVPGLPFLLAIPVLVFAIGLTSRDGLVVLFGYVLLMPAIYIIYRAI